MDEHLKPKKILSEEIHGRKTLRTTKKMLDNRRRGGLQEDEHPRLASEDRTGGGLCGRPRSIIDCSPTLTMISTSVQKQLICIQLKDNFCMDTRH
jgi:hypothetical protein